VLRWSSRETYANFITALQAAAVEGKPARSGRELLDRWTASLWPRPAASSGRIAASGFSRSARKVSSWRWWRTGKRRACSKHRRPRSAPKQPNG
jgi:hypothetical protein